MRAFTREFLQCQLLTCPTRYFEDASSINFRRCVTYGLGVLETSLRFRLQKWGLHSSAIFSGGK